jgi:hypothetical protein
LFAGRITIGGGKVISTAIALKTVKKHGGGAVPVVAIRDLVRDVHGEDDVIDLRGQLPGGNSGEERGEEIGLKVGGGPTGVPTGPVDAEEIFGGNLAAFEIIVGEFAGVGTIGIGDDEHVEAAASGASALDEWAEQKKQEKWDNAGPGHAVGWR